MKTLCLLISILAFVWPGARANEVSVDAELVDHGWLKSVLVYSYYWYLDDHFFVDMEKGDAVELWVRQVKPPSLDEGDHSRFAEIWLPASQILLSLKKADYAIPELALQVQSKQYHVVRGSYDLEATDIKPDKWCVVRLPRDEVEAVLRLARTQLHAPANERKEFVIAAIRREMEKLGGVVADQTIYIAARTDVSTSIWAYWLERRTLYQFSGDIDAVDPSLMKSLPLMVRSYSLASNVVASAEEAHGRNSMITREFASRALFLCMARGEAFKLKP